MAQADRVKRRLTPAARTGQLLDAAAQVLEQLGAEGFTTNAVSKAAGVGIGTVYKGHASADAVLLAREGERFTARL